MTFKIAQKPLKSGAERKAVLGFTSTDLSITHTSHRRVNNDSDRKSGIIFEDYELDLSLRSVLPLTTHDTTSLTPSVLDSFSTHVTTQNYYYPSTGRISLPYFSLFQTTGNRNSGCLGQQGSVTPNIEPEHSEHTSWEITWRTPTFICSTLIAGFVLSLGHHFYYNH